MDRRDFEIQLVADPWRSWQGSPQEAVKSLHFSQHDRPQAVTQEPFCTSSYTAHSAFLQEWWKTNVKTLRTHKCSQLQKGKPPKNEEACWKNDNKGGGNGVDLSRKNGHEGPIREALSQSVSPMHSQGGVKGSSWLRTVMFLNSGKLPVKYKADQRIWGEVLSIS